MKLTAFFCELEKTLGREAVLWGPNDVMRYENDGLSSLRPPYVVVFPPNTVDLVQMVKFAAHSKLRGPAACGLSGLQPPGRFGLCYDDLGPSLWAETGFPPPRE